MIRGIDVSHFQGSVNWAALRDKHHLSFAAAKCSEGIGFADSRYAGNRAGARAAGLQFIGYHFARPESSSAVAQARWFVQLAGHADALCLDLEASNLSQAATNAWMRQFGDSLRELAPGVPTVVYLGGYAANGSGAKAVDHFDHWWFPRYTGRTSWPDALPSDLLGKNTTGWDAPHIWQWTDNLAGMDANVSDLTLDELFGGDMALTDADAAVLWGHKLPSKRIDPTTGKPTGAEIPAGAFLTSVDVNVWTIMQTLSLDAIASAVKAVLPPGQGGDFPTADEIAAAAIARLAAQLGGTS